MMHDDAILLFRGMITAAIILGVLIISAAFFIREKIQSLIDVIQQEQSMPQAERKRG